MRERVRADRRDQDHRQRGVDDRAAGREVVGGRAGGRREDQPVRAVARDQLAVDLDAQLDDARERALGDHHVVERPVGERGAGRAHQLDVEQRALLGA